ncbi:hypothetical protein BDZ91DRAFT_769156, partial [Kalaharituber pfeilii]
RVFESSQVQPYREGLSTSSKALPVVYNNYEPVISLMARLGSIFCLKCEADEEKEKIVSMVLSDKDVKIFCNPQQVAEMVVWLFPRAYKPPKSSGTVSKGEGEG